MNTPLTTETDLAAIRARDADSAATWFRTPAIGACGRAFIDRRWLLAEIERLRQEVKRLMCFMPEHDTRETYRCIVCGAFHLHDDVSATTTTGESK